MIPYVIRHHKSFFCAVTVISFELPVTGENFFRRKKGFPGPHSKIRCGISLAAIGKHERIIVVDEEFA